MKTLVNKCPSACYSAVLAPVLESFLPYMYERMGERWKYLAALRESPSFDEDNADSQEVMDDVVCRSVVCTSTAELQYLGQGYLALIKRFMENPYNLKMLVM